MIDRSHALPLARQAQQLGISRGSIYCLPRPVSDSDLTFMRRSTSWISCTRSLAAGCCAICSGRRA